MKGSLREGAPAQAGEGEGENVIVHADFALSQAPSVTRKGSCHLPLGGRLCSRELTHKLTIYHLNIYFFICLQTSMTAKTDAPAV